MLPRGLEGFMDSGGQSAQQFLMWAARQASNIAQPAWQPTFADIEYQDGSPVAVRVIGKGDKERRVPLSQTAQAALMRWLRERKTHGNPVTPWVWSPLAGKRYGQPMQARTIEKMLDTAAERAGLDPKTVSPHKLRHTFATALLNNGRTLDEIKELLGHENIQTTMIYAQTDTRRVAAAAAALPDVVWLGSK